MIPLEVMGGGSEGRERYERYSCRRARTAFGGSEVKSVSSQAFFPPHNFLLPSPTSTSFFSTPPSVVHRHHLHSLETALLSAILATRLRHISLPDSKPFMPPLPQVCTTYLQVTVGFGPQDPPQNSQQSANSCSCHAPFYSSWSLIREPFGSDRHALAPQRIVGCFHGLAQGRFGSFSPAPESILEQQSPIPFPTARTNRS